MTAAPPGGFCPYVGLAPFEAAHADYFFGRDADTAVLADNLLARPLTLFYGESGVGKSSLLNVGLAKTLHGLRLPDVRLRWRRWSSRAEIDALRATLAALEPAADGAPTLIVLDQFEELFNYASAGDREALARALADTLEREDLDPHVALALRSDALHRLDEMRLRIPELFDVTFELKHLRAPDVRRAVQGPIEEYNRRFRGPGAGIVVEPALVDALVAQLQQADPLVRSTGEAVPPDRIELAILQLALEALWTTEGGPAAGELRRATLVEDLGGVNGIADRHVRQIFDALGPRERHWAAKFLDYLVTPSGGKIAYPVRDIANRAGAPVEPIRALLHTLADRPARLLRSVGRTAPDIADSERFELFHDTLAGPVLDWRGAFLPEAPFAFLTDLFSGKVHGFGGLGRLFGRRTAEEGDILAVQRISRYHLIVLQSDELLDLRSAYGTTVNGLPVRIGDPMRCRDGDVVVLANMAAYRYTPIDSVDDDLASQADATRGCRALILDGVARTAVPLHEEPGYIVAAPDDRIRLSATPAAGALAEVSFTDGGTFLKALDTRDGFDQVLMRDSFADEMRPVPAGERVAIGFWTTEPAHERALFAVGRRRFEIVENVFAR